MRRKDGHTSWFCCCVSLIMNSTPSVLVKRIKYTVTLHPGNAGFWWLSLSENFCGEEWNPFKPRGGFMGKMQRSSTKRPGFARGQHSQKSLLFSLWSCVFSWLLLPAHLVLSFPLGRLALAVLASTRPPSPRTLYDLQFTWAKSGLELQLHTLGKKKKRIPGFLRAHKYIPNALLWV